MPGKRYPFLDLTVLPQLRALPHPPSLTLEMDRVSDMAASLDLLELDPPG